MRTLRIGLHNGHAARTMIRLLPLQMDHFRAAQLAEFAHAVADEIAALKITGQRGMCTTTQLRAFARAQAGAARHYHLDGEFMVKGFILCAWLYGEDFARKTPFADALSTGESAALKRLFLQRAYFCEPNDG